MPCSATAARTATTSTPSPGACRASSAIRSPRPRSAKSVSQRFIPCNGCHADADPDNPGMPGLKTAYHRQCFTCHRGMGNIGTDPKGCAELCHAKEAGKERPGIDGKKAMIHAAGAWLPPGKEKGPMKGPNESDRRDPAAEHKDAPRPEPGSRHEPAGIPGNRCHHRRRDHGRLREHRRGRPRIFPDGRTAMAF